MRTRWGARVGAILLFLGVWAPVPASANCIWLILVADLDGVAEETALPRVREFVAQRIAEYGEARRTDGPRRHYLRADIFNGMDFLLDHYDQTVQSALLKIVKASPHRHERFAALDVLAHLGPKAEWVADDLELLADLQKAPAKEWFETLDFEPFFALLVTLSRVRPSEHEGWALADAAMTDWILKRQALGEKNPEGLPHWVIDAGKFAAFLTEVSVAASSTLTDLINDADDLVEKHVSDLVFRRPNAAHLDTYTRLVGGLRAAILLHELANDIEVSLTEGFEIFLNETEVGPVYQADRERLRRLSAPLRLLRKISVDPELEVELLAVLERLVQNVSALSARALNSGEDRQEMEYAQETLVEFVEAIAEVPTTIPDQFLELTKGLDGVPLFGDKEPDLYARSRLDRLADARMPWYPGAQ
ncbi:hypothetical protein K2X33_15505 [bacterium]|nr:hypothetical protein [bacterium]